VKGRFLVHILALGVAAVAYAALPGDLRQAQVRVWNAEHGVPEENIYSLQETPDGFLWLGTRAGLYRFNGKIVQKIPLARDGKKAGEGIGGFHFSEGKLWIGGRDYLAVARPGPNGTYAFPHIDIFPFDFPSQDRYGLRTVRHLGGNRVLAHRSDGLYEVQVAGGSGTGHRTIHATDAGAPVLAWTRARGGGEWVATPRAILRIGGPDPESRPAPPGPAASNLLESRDGELYALNEAGLHVWRGGRWTVRLRHPAITKEAIRTLIEDGAGNLWVGLNGAVARIGSQGTEVLNLERWIRSDDTVQSLQEGADGSIWAGTRWGSLLRLEQPLFFRTDMKDGLGESAASAVAVDEKGRVWAGIRLSGLYEGKGKQWRSIPGTDKGLFYAVEPISRGRILMATSEGLDCWDGKRLERIYTHQDHLVLGRYLSVRRAADGQIYFNDPSRVYRLEERGGRWSYAELGKFPLVRAIVPVKEGLYWASWSRGLALWEGGALHEYGFPDGRRLQGMTAWEMNEHFVALGTNEGVYFFDRQQRRFAPRPPWLEEHQIFGFRDDGQGRIWLLGRNGLLVVARRELERFAREGGTAPNALRFTTREGLPSGNFGLGTSSLSARESDGTLWMASLSGLVRFKPERVVPPGLSPKTVIVSVTAAEREYSLLDPIQLEPGPKRVVIGFSSPRWWNLQAPLLRYRLEGHDLADVHGSGTAPIVYNLTQPGRYRFQLTSYLPGQTEPGESDSFEFEIAPYWYQQPIARGLAIITVPLVAALLLEANRRRATARRVELERRVEERTEDLAQARDEAEAARRHAEGAAAAKAEFLATMSHEIRTPLNGVLGMIELLEHTPLNAEQRQDLLRMRQAGEALRVVVNDVLDFSKIEAGSLNLERVAFELRPFVHEAAEIVRPAAEEKGLQYRVAVQAPADCWVMGDPTRIRQILLNLLGNAAKFTDRGAVTMEASWSDGVCVFSVEDSGIGIAPDKIAPIFEAFTQADTSTTRRYGGTGLGLAISNRLARAMNGKLEVDSTPGRGSRFTLTLPLELAAARETKPGLAPEPETASRPSSEYSPLKVLLVEDNATNRRVAFELLRRLGCSVETAEDGQQAVDLTERQDFDLIFMDCHMPVMDGFAATRQIRRRAGTAGRTPIVALTAGITPEDHERCRDAGMTGHLAKPVRKEDLARIVREAELARAVQ
jgi:signal transduction histidine kinase/CheY-like chemotaxis protein/ligand-binding sensor domain-containing protein